MVIDSSAAGPDSAAGKALGARLLRTGVSAPHSAADNDPVVQNEINQPLAMPAPLKNFEGVNNIDGVYPPDTQGDIGYDPATGKKYYVQWVNLHFAVWDVTGVTPTLALGPLAGNTLWQGFGGDCETHNDGDPITLYDTISHRWFMSQFAVGGTGGEPNYQCIAVSKTSDPTGAWYRYAYLWTNNTGISVMNDYPHFGVWPDAYYMTVNQFGPTSAGCDALSEWCGTGIAAFERSKMLKWPTGADDLLRSLSRRCQRRWHVAL